MQHPQPNDRTRNAGCVRGPDVNSGSSGHGLADFDFVHQRRTESCLVVISKFTDRCRLTHKCYRRLSCDTQSCEYS